MRVPRALCAQRLGVTGRERKRNVLITLMLMLLGYHFELNLTNGINSTFALHMR